MGDDALDYFKLIGESAIGDVMKECVGKAVRMVEAEISREIDKDTEKEIEKESDKELDKEIDKEMIDSILLTPPATDPDSPATECKDNLDNQAIDGVYSDTIASEDSKPDSFDNIVCKWTNCDWPGAHDDLVDHIMEIHVELQPYHNHHDIVSSSSLSSSSSSSYISSSLLTSSSLNAFASVSQNFSSTSNSSNKYCQKWGTMDASSSIDQPSQQYVCLWEGCKVYGKGSSSRTWLERHVLQHSGPRPFKCIVEGCSERFKKREALEKHVNNHFNLPMTDLSSSCNNNCSSTLPNVPSEADSNNSNCNTSNTNNIYSNEQHSSQSSGPVMMSTKGLFNGYDLNSNISSGTVTPNKLLKRKKVKAKKKSFNVKANEDYFDDGIMDIIKFKLMEISMLTGLDVLGNQSDVVLHSKVIGRCCPEKGGSVKVLIHWEPEGFIPDEWILETDLDEMSSRRVPLKSLPIDSLLDVLDKPQASRSRGRKYKKA